MRALTSTIGLRTRLGTRWLAAVGLAAVVVSAAGVGLVTSGHDGWPAVAALLSFFLLMAPYAAYLTTSFARDVGGWLRTSRAVPAQMILAFGAVYALYGVGTQTFSLETLARVLTFVTVPTVLVVSVRRRSHVTWQDFAAIAAIWLPFDTGLLTSVWTWPEGGGAYILNTALAVDVAVALFAGYRGFVGVAPRLRLQAGDVRLVALALLGFLAVALPFGFGTSFITWHPQIAQLTALKVIGTPLGIFLFIALPEELLFRGLVQNLLERRLGRPNVALALTAVAFGATHLNNGPSPDWRYFVLATVAGFFYGAVYRKTRSLAAPAILHAAVDALWVLFLHT